MTEPTDHAMGATGRDAGMLPDRWAFNLGSATHSIFTRGFSRRLEPGPAATLDERVRAFFAGASGDRGAPGLLVGALPFDREADDMLFAPLEVLAHPRARDAAAPIAAQPFHVHPELSREEYADTVRRALALLAADPDGEAPLRKVVLARALTLAAEGGIDPQALWSRLHPDPQAVRFLTPVAGPEAAPRHLVGATPELLASRRGDRVVSHPLAGSARRSVDMTADEDAARALMASEKDRREHAMVVEAIMDQLAPLCRDLEAPAEPALVSTRTMWHLGTRIMGRLRETDGIGAAGLAALLHPTPAVCGSPRDAAAAAIAALEPFDRGFYAGAVGWTDSAGDGDWYVSLRCAEVGGDAARLYAGAGIVPGSDPEAEAQETSDKLLAMLRAFGIDETGRPLAAV